MTILISSVMWELQYTNNDSGLYYEVTVSDRELLLTDEDIPF